MKICKTFVRWGFLLPIATSNVGGILSLGHFIAVFVVTFYIKQVKAVQVVVGLDKVAYLLVTTCILL